MLYLAPGLTGGIETYGRGLLRALDQHAPREHQIVVFLSKWAAESLGNFSDRVRLQAIDARLENRVLKNLYEQLRFPSLVHAQSIDVLHSLAYVGPVLSAIPHVLTVPDLNFKFPGHEVKGMKRFILSRLCYLTAARSSRIIAISAFTKREIEKYWPEMVKKTSVVHLGSEEPDIVSISRTQPDTNYLLFIGGGTHKNSAIAVRAFGKIPLTADWSLTLVGRIDEGVAAELANLPLAKQKLVKSVGFQPRAKLDELLAQAGCLIVPSRYEGFGLPVIEAQNRGVPVICSNAASLPEVAGQGALLFAPDDEECLVSHMTQVALSDNLRRELVSRGRENVIRYSWLRTAEETLRVYHLALHGKPQVP